MFLVQSQILGQLGLHREKNPASTDPVPQKSCQLKQTLLLQVGLGHDASSHQQKP